MGGQHQVLPKPRPPQSALGAGMARSGDSTVMREARGRDEERRHCGVDEGGVGSTTSVFFLALIGSRESTDEDPSEGVRRRRGGCRGHGAGLELEAAVFDGGGEQVWKHRGGYRRAGMRRVGGKRRGVVFVGNVNHACFICQMSYSCNGSTYHLLWVGSFLW